MIVEGRVMIGKLPETLDGHVEALEMKAKKVAPGARNIFNSTPPLQEATPAMYEGSGRSMIESPTPHDRENEILREILWQVEARSPSQTEMEDVRPQAEHIVSVGDPTFVLTAKDQVCQWQVPHRDGIDDKAAAVLVALSPDGANFLFWGPVRQQERPRRTEAKMVHINFGEFVFFSHRQVHSGGAYAGFNARLYWSFQTTRAQEGTSQTVPVPMAPTADIEESVDHSGLEEVTLVILPSLS